MRMIFVWILISVLLPSTTWSLPTALLNLPPDDVRDVLTFTPTQEVDDDTVVNILSYDFTPRARPKTLWRMVERKPPAPKITPLNIGGPWFKAGLTRGSRNGNVAENLQYTLTSREQVMPVRLTAGFVRTTNGQLVTSTSASLRCGACYYRTDFVQGVNSSYVMNSFGVRGAYAGFTTINKGREQKIILSFYPYGH